MAEKKKLAVPVSNDSVDILDAARKIFGSSRAQVVEAALELYDKAHKVRDQAAERYGRRNIA